MESGGELSRKRISLSKLFRSSQLQEMFSIARGEAVKSVLYNAQAEGEIQSRGRIDKIIIDLRTGLPGSISNLYDHCLQFCFRYLTETHLQEMACWLGEEKGSDEEIEQMVAIVSNWAVTKTHYQLDHIQLFRFLLQTLQKHPNLSKSIFYSLINLSKNSKHASLLITFDLVEVVVANTYNGFSTFQDAACLLRNILSGAPGALSECHLRTLLAFLGRMLHLCFRKQSAREDYMSILISIISITEVHLKQLIIYSLEEELKQIIFFALQQPNPKTILALLSSLYSSTGPHCEWLKESAFCLKLWEKINPYLLNIGDILPESQKYHFWRFIQSFLRVEFEERQPILQWLASQCLQNKAGDWEEHLLPILVTSLDPQQALLLISEKLERFQSLEELTASLLAALLHIYYSKETVKKEWLGDKLRLSVCVLSSDDRPQISSLAQEVRTIWEQLQCCRMEVEWGEGGSG